MRIQIILVFSCASIHLSAMDVALLRYSNKLASEDKETLNEQDETLQTALHLAVCARQAQTVAELLEGGADTSKVDRYGNTPLHEAAAQGFDDIMSLLVPKSSLALRNYQGETPLHRICESKSSEGLLALISKGKDLGEALNTFDRSSRTPLHRACEVGWLDGVTVMMDHGAQLSLRAEGVNGKVPLAELCSLSRSAWTDEHLAIARRLLGVCCKELEACTDDGMTPLLFASLNNHDALVRVLIAEGANINALSNHGFSVVLGAVLADSASLLDFLIGHRAVVNSPVVSLSGSALNLACARNSYACAKVLLKKGQASVSIPDSAGNTAFHLAVQQGDLKLVLLLRKFGAELETRGEADRTPLHMACARGFKEIAAYLIAQGAHIEALDCSGKTPALVAFEQRHWHLLEEGKDTVAGRERLHHALGRENGLSSSIAH